MADLSVLVNRQLKKIVDDAIGSTEEAVREFGEQTYDDILSRSPVITHYYKSNHRINLIGPKGGGQPKAKLEPPIKDSEEPGVYSGNVSVTRAEETAKLANFRLGDSIRISTGVPYAEEVERKHGVYSGAGAILGARLKRLEVDDG
jgi:hypothetical protein